MLHWRCLPGGTGMHKRVLPDMSSRGQLSEGRKWDAAECAGEHAVMDQDRMADRRPNGIGQNVLVDMLVRDPPARARPKQFRGGGENVANAAPGPGHDEVGMRVPIAHRMEVT